MDFDQHVVVADLWERVVICEDEVVEATCAFDDPRLDGLWD